MALINDHLSKINALVNQNGLEDNDEVYNAKEYEELSLASIGNIIGGSRSSKMDPPSFKSPP